MNKNLSIFILLITFSVISQINTYAQSRKVSINKEDAPISEVLKAIETQTNFTFIYDSKIVDVNKKTTVNIKDVDLTEALKVIFLKTDIEYSVFDEKIILKKKSQEKRTISGKVVDELGEPVVGASVFIPGTQIASFTNLDGTFQLSGLDYSATNINFSCIGYISQSAPINDRAVINITLAEDRQLLEGTVVTALGIKRSEKALGYSVQKVQGDDLNVVKGVNVASTMTGKIAGLNVMNSTEFGESPTISLRGESPLLVIDGIPYGNMTLNEVPSDDIESISVLKGATASALYGSRGGSGAIIVTTKRGGGKSGMTISMSSSNIFEVGYTVIPEVQSSYSGGMSGQYDEDFVWGDKLDIGRTAVQYDPISQEWGETELTSRGKDNLKNFMQAGIVSNNNVNIAYNGENGGFRSSLSYVHNKGQYPNMKQNKFTYSLGGDIKLDKFTFEGNISFNKRFYPNNHGTGYGTGGYLYNILVWSGTDYDLRDYKNYWVKGKEDIQQSWWTENWYDNPWFIANEIVRSNDYNVTNGFASISYDVSKNFKVMVRSGFDSYSSKTIERNAKSAIGGWDTNGYYYQRQVAGYSLNNDIMATYDLSIGKFNLNILGGGSIYYYEDENVWNETNNGLSVPGFYSISASVDVPNTGSSKGEKQVNSIYGKASLAWDDYLFLDITARNDWSSALPQNTRSYFYPSFAGSFIVSELIKLPEWWDILKVRASWTQTKSDISIYDTKNVYDITTNRWDGMNSAEYPGTIRPDDLRSQNSTTYEIGAAMHWFTNRAWVDLTYYNKLNTDFVTTASVSEASGYDGFYVNSDEERQRSGVEIAIGGEPILTNDFSWTTSFNWSRDRYTYKKISEEFSSKYPWVKEGERVDWEYSWYKYDAAPDGQLVHGANGLPVRNEYLNLVGYSDPDWIWGFNNTFKYKNFTLNVQFDGRVGGTAYNMMQQSLMNSGAHVDTDTPERYEEVVNGNINYIGQGVKVVSGTVERDEYGNVTLDNRVFAPNDKAVSYESYIRTYYPGRYSPVPHTHAELTFIKLRELSVGYTFPKTMTDKWGINDLTLSAVGNNLWIWAKEFKYADPDRGSDNLNSPSVRYLGFDVRFSF